MSYETLLLTKQDGISTVTLNRPEKFNAMNDAMFAELIDVFTTLDKDPKTRTIVLAANGRGFCAGGDLNMSIYNTTDANVLDRFMTVVGDLIKAIRNNSKPTIAAVQGVAAGGGISIALACDMIIASEKAKFSAIFATKNLHPDSGATFFLPQVLGNRKALELLLTGRMVMADEAKEIGLVNNVVAEDALDAAVLELATATAKVHPVVSRMIKASVYGCANSDLSTALEAETRSVMTVMTSGLWK